MKPTVGSLFAGIGGFDLGFERAGFETVWQVEIDDYCRRVLERHFPRAERFGDIRECGAHNLKAVDVICGGFPCQDISTAGRRAGIDGQRSGLWSEMRRIVCELRPDFVLVENVSALLYGGMERVIGELAESGYDAEWDCLPASAFGAPHQRDRVWILAYPLQRSRCPESRQQQSEWTAISDSSSAGNVANSHGQPKRGLPIRTEKKHASFGECGQNVAHASSLRQSGQGQPSEWRGAETNGKGKANQPLAKCFGSQWAVEPNVGRVANGIPARMDRLRGLGNAVVPQIAQYLAERIKAVMEA